LHLTSRGFGLEVEITALVCKTRARTYEVPISYYGRSYEEGKKIGLKDGIMALWYIFYFNLIKPRLGAGRHYVRAVNTFLDETVTRPHREFPSHSLADHGTWPLNRSDSVVLSGRER
jgi:hypothetical protein